MKLIKTKMHDCFEIQPNVFNDDRGRFIKTYHQEIFGQNGLNTSWAEEYYSTSKKNVIRGMHFQLPPYDHEKLVYCVSGAVMDVVLDLRRSSPMFQQYICIELTADDGNMLYIPRGCAHGFKSLYDNTIMMYKVATTYNPSADCGVAWNSCGINWFLEESPTISIRDSSFICLEQFETPFS